MFSILHYCVYIICQNSYKHILFNIILFLLLKHQHHQLLVEDYLDQQRHLLLLQVDYLVRRQHLNQHLQDYLDQLQHQHVRHSFVFNFIVSKLLVGDILLFVYVLCLILFVSEQYVLLC